MLDHLKKYDIILASQSPRRQELLKGLDVEFKIEVRPINEQYDSCLESYEITDYLAALKASAFKNDLKDNQLIITSDTIVWHNGRAIEKPKNESDARNMIKELSGSFHEVYTSVCFTTTDHQKTIHDKTIVHFKDLSQQEIDYYVNKYQPMDKAGAYGIQDWLGYTSVRAIEGCYYNVMGLPLPVVYDVLKKWPL